MDRKMDGREFVMHELIEIVERIVTGDEDRSAGSPPVQVGLSVEEFQHRFSGAVQRNHVALLHGCSGPPIERITGFAIASSDDGLIAIDEPFCLIS